MAELVFVQRDVVRPILLLQMILWKIEPKTEGLKSPYSQLEPAPNWVVQ